MSQKNTIEHKLDEYASGEYYSARDSVYRTVWHPDGSLHWGIFTSENQTDVVGAMEHTTKFIGEKAGLSPTDTVVDIGCGAGVEARLLHRQFGCRVVGVDNNEYKIRKAREAAQRLSGVDFIVGSAFQLPLQNNSATAAVSQGVFYHFPDREAGKARAIKEVQRVLQDDGRFIFEDIIRLVDENALSDKVKTDVINRMQCSYLESKEGYKKLLEQEQFEVVEVVDLSIHLQKTYELVLNTLRAAKDEVVTLSNAEIFNEFNRAWQTMVDTAGREVGWALFLAKKKSQ